MKILETPILGLRFLEPDIHEDARGYFYRWFCKDELKSAGIVTEEIVQANHSYSRHKGTFRGLHFQNPPYAEEKIVKCTKEIVLDIIVDLRKGSKTFLSSYQTELSEENHKAILIPKGCAHGFITLSDNSELMYLHSQYYKPEYEQAVSVFDPRLKIVMPIDIREISIRDQQHGFLSNEFAGIEL